MESLEFCRVTYNLQENSVILSTSGPSLKAGDRVRLVVEYDARVNYNVLAGLVMDDKYVIHIFHFHPINRSDPSL